MNISPIRTERDYKSALKEVSTLVDLDPDLGSEEGDRLEVLSILVETYEAKHYPIDLPDPVEAIKFHMESAGLTVKDLEPLIGRSNRVYEVLDRTRPLTLRMIRNLHESLGIPAESLIKRPQHA